MNNENQVNEVATELEKLDLDLEQNDDETMPNWAKMRVSISGLLARQAMSLIMRTERDLILSVPKKGIRVIISSTSLCGCNPKSWVDRVERIPVEDKSPTLLMAPTGHNPHNIFLEAWLPSNITGGREGLRPHRFMKSWVEERDSKFLALKDGTDPVCKTEKIVLNQALDGLGIECFLNAGTDWGWIPVVLDGEKSPYWDNHPLVWDASASPEPQPQAQEPESNDDIPIKDLEFSVRSRNCLETGNIKTLGQLADVSIDELMQIKHFSEKCLTEIREKLAQYGLKLKNDIEI